MRKWKMRLWALRHADGGLVYSDNVPSLYTSRQEAWYDGDDDISPFKVDVTMSEIKPRGKR